MAAALTAAGAAVLGLIVAFAPTCEICAWPRPAFFILAVLVVVAATAMAWMALVTAGGLISLRRDTFEEKGRPYARNERREHLHSPSLGRWHAALCQVFSLDIAAAPLFLLAGEWVEVRSVGEILATLDANGRLDGVPFMPEMAAFCGMRARVFRRVDKLNDWIYGTGLRRMGGLVLLESLRCNGSAHGGCQSNCHLRWREAWLRRVDAPPAMTHIGGEQHAAAARIEQLDRFTQRDADPGGAPRYMCQATELTAGGKPIHRADLRHYVRDLLTGNVRPRPFFTGLAIAAFNQVQELRGGITFPHYQYGAVSTSPHEILDLKPGELVRVKPKHLIEATLNNRRRNRGLWFDGEMLRFCGGEYLVKTRADRVIVEKTGELRTLTNPCVILEGVLATGEYQGFNPENEHIFWREIWLERVASGTAPSDSASPTGNNETSEERQAI